jgi:hypothetical protein
MTIREKFNQNCRPKAYLHYLLGIVLMLGWLLLANPLGKAQLTTTGTINGSVADQSGAVVAGAEVAITQLETGTATKTSTNSAGSFVQVGLDPGHYNVTISSAGFTTYRETNIYLAPTGAYTVNAVLKPGAVATTVTVAASEAQVQTTTSEISFEISSTQSEALPLNGRNYQGLGSVMPGVVSTGIGTAMGTGGYTTTNSLSVDGAGAIGSLYTLDGVWNFDTVEHNQNTIIPNPDEIADVKVLANNYSSKYNLLGVGVIMVQTKSGGDTYHGGGWEFLRNTFLDSRPYFIPVSTGIPPEEWNIFGWQLGGPLAIPKLGGPKKTYFYFNNQYVRQRQAITSGNTGQAPTAEMRGIGTPNNELLFPGTAASPVPGSGPYGTAFLTDPTLPAGHCSSATNRSSCFAQDASGNWIVPANRVDQNALNYMNTLVNVPNAQLASGGNNFINNNPYTNRQMDVLAKVDHDFSPKYRVTGEWMIENNNYINSAATRMGSPFTYNWDTFISTDEIGKIGVTQVYSSNLTNETSASMSSLVETHDFGGIRLLSQLTNFTQKLPYSGYFLQNYIPHMAFTGGWSQFGASSCCIVPQATALYEGLTDDLGYLHGKHFIEAGIIYLRGHTRQWNGASASGSPLSNGAFTFNGYATGSPVADYMLGYVQEFQQSAGAFRKYMQYPMVSPYIEDTYKVARRLTLTAGLRYMWTPWASTQSGDTSVFEPNLYDALQAPAVNAAGTITSAAGSYNPINGVIINGQNGVPLNLLINQHRNYLAPDFGFAWDIFGTGRTALRGGYSVVYDKQIEGDCASLCVDAPLVQQLTLLDVGFDNPAGASPPATAQFTSSLDLYNYRAAQVQTYSLSLEQQMKGWIFTVAGAAADTAHMPISNVNANAFPINQPQPTTMGGVSYNFNPNLNNSSYSPAYYGPYQGYNGIGLYTSILKASWSGLELSARHPVGHNLNVTAAYTWSHNLDNLGANGGVEWVNPFNLHSAWGNSVTSGDTPQIFSGTALYSLPFFQHANGWENVLLGGWRYSDFTAIQSGTFQTVGVTGSTYGLATTPNRIAAFSYPKMWKAYKSPAGGAYYLGGEATCTVFCQPAAGYYGNSGVGTVHGPGLMNFDMALYKDFPVWESLSLTFRAEYFNVFNHTEPTSMNSTYGSSAFGTITNTKDPRIGELSMKFNF